MEQVLNTIYNIDCLDIIKQIDNNTIDLVILDPPYNVGAAKWDIIDNYFEWMINILEETERVLKTNGSLYLWGMSKNNDFLKLKIWMDENFKKMCFKNWIVWVHDVKIHKLPKDKYLTKHEDLLFYSGENNTFNYVRDDPPEFQLKMHSGKYDENYFIKKEDLPPSQQKIFKNGLHLGSPAKSWWKGPANQSAGKIYKKFPGYKSEWVCERIVSVSSKVGDIVLIPFVGTGTECYVCGSNNRKFIGAEIDKDRFELSVNRNINFLGK